jgi:acetyltransferase-like isoleucine patch superfamily enzyme
MLMIAVLPSPAKRFVLNRFFGHDIHPTARIGLSFISAERIVLEEGSRIGHLSYIDSLELLKLERYAKIGNLNHIKGMISSRAVHFHDETNRKSELVVGAHASVVARHYLDCCNSVQIGRFTTIAGQHSQILTHGIDIIENRQTSAPVKIGEYCMIATGCVILKGTTFPPRSVLAANSTLHRSALEPYTIYSGVPAKPVASIDPSAKYFHRTQGGVG